MLPGSQEVPGKHRREQAAERGQKGMSGCPLPCSSHVSLPGDQRSWDSPGLFYQARLSGQGMPVGSSGGGLTCLVGPLRSGGQKRER